MVLVIVGNKNAITYKEVFPLIKENRVWLGHTAVKEFMRPDGSTKKFGNVGWYTNLSTEKRHEELILVKRYRGHEGEYPRYENYDAINVDRVKDIPEDYFGVMGVPITFLDKYCPEQFEIVGCTESEGHCFSQGLWDVNSRVKQPVVAGDRKYKRIFIRRRHGEGLAA